MNADSKRRDSYYKRYFGITLDQYEDLLGRQHGNCKCCGLPVKAGSKRLSVDHSHSTGEIRGLLCFRCNHLLIGRQEDPSVFQRAADYLRGPFTGWFVPDEYLKGQKKKRRRKKKKI